MNRRDLSVGAPVRVRSHLYTAQGGVAFLSPAEFMLVGAPAIVVSIPSKLKGWSVDAVGVFVHGMFGFVWRSQVQEP